MLSRFRPLAMKTCVATFVFSAAFAMSPSAHAQTLTQFTFGTVANATSTGAGYSPTTVGTNVTASDLTITGATNVSMSINATVYPTAALLFIPNVSADSTTFATTSALAVSGNRFFSFSVTPNTGFQTSFTSLTFDAGVGGTGLRGYVVRSSVDGFASNIATANIVTTRPNLVAVSVPLTGAAFQDVLTPTTFRVYSYTAFNGQTVDYDNVTVNGTTALAVAVPESSTMVLLGLAGALGAVRIIRRKK